MATQQQIEPYKPDPTDPMELAILKQQVAEKKREFDARLNKLKESAIQRLIETNYDYEDQTYQMYIGFYNLALSMQRLMDKIEGFNVVLGFAGDLIQFLDLNFNAGSLLVKHANGQKYTFRSRMKVKRDLRKMSRNNLQRIKQTVYMIRMQSEMIVKLQDMLNGALNDVTAAINTPRRRGRKKGPQSTAPRELTPEERMIREEAIRRGGGDPNGGWKGTSTPGGNPPTQPGPGGIDPGSVFGQQP